MTYSAHSLPSNCSPDAARDVATPPADHFKEVPLGNGETLLVKGRSPDCDRGDHSCCDTEACTCECHGSISAEPAIPALPLDALRGELYRLGREERDLEREAQALQLVYQETRRRQASTRAQLDGLREYLRVMGGDSDRGTTPF